MMIFEEVNRRWAETFESTVTLLQDEVSQPRYKLEKPKKVTMHEVGQDTENEGALMRLSRCGKVAALEGFW